MLNSPIDSIEDKFINEKDEQEDNDNEYEKEIRSEWMLLVKMDPNTTIDNYLDFHSALSILVNDTNFDIDSE